MKIESIKIKNFRSYKEETTLCLDDLTVLVGRNEIHQCRPHLPVNIC